METTTRNKIGGSEVLKLPYMIKPEDVWFRDSQVKESVGELFSYADIKPEEIWRLQPEIKLEGMRF